MSKFAKNLSSSNKEIKESRAQMLAEEVGLEVGQFVGRLKKERLSLRNKINGLTDLGPESKDSLRPIHSDFNAKNWVEELHQAKLDLKLKTIELEEAVAIEKEWFTESTDED